MLMCEVNQYAAVAPKCCSQAAFDAYAASTAVPAQSVHEFCTTPATCVCLPVGTPVTEETANTYAACPVTGLSPWVCRIDEANNACRTS